MTNLKDVERQVTELRLEVEKIIKELLEIRIVLKQLRKEFK